MKERRNERFDALFKEFIEKQNSAVNNYYNSTSRYYGGYGYTVYFYEWSNINNRPRQFGSVEVFIKFLKDSGIHFTDYQEQRLRDGRWFYCSCKVGKSELILCDTYIQLKERLDNKF
jgi:hypothetical protein